MDTTDLVHSRYRLIEEVGRGAMGVVWRAEDTLLGREVAIKELLVAPGGDPVAARERFLVEARAAARLSHPNIIAVYDVLSAPDRVHIAMELVVGPTLAMVVQRSGAQPAELVRAVMAQVAHALAAAHSARVVHRDLKPDNVFWTAAGRVVVADFGIARIGAGGGTVEGTVMGTPGYMAPEQVRGLPVGPAADVFAWGVMAYELATGAAPFGEPSQTDPSALAYRIVHEPPGPLELPDDPALAALIAKALSKDPADRPPDGSGLVAAMAGATSDPTEVEAAVTTLEAEVAASDTADELAPDVGSAAAGISRRDLVLIVRGATLTLLLGLVVILAVFGRGSPTTVASANRSATVGPQPTPPPGTSVVPSTPPTTSPPEMTLTTEAPSETTLPGHVAQTTVPQQRTTVQETTMPPTTVPTTIADVIIIKPDTTTPTTSPPTTNPQPRTPAAPLGASARNEPVACAAVVGIVCGTAIQVSWRDNSNNETGFEMSNGNESRSVGANTSSYFWSGLARGTYMCVRVRAVNADGASDWTPYACATATQ